MATKIEPYREGQFYILIEMVVTQIHTVHMTVLYRKTLTQLVSHSQVHVIQVKSEPVLGIVLCQLVFEF